MSAIVDVERTKLGARGYRYRVWHNGEILVENTGEPMGAAARALVDKGVTGRMQMRRLGSLMIDMEGLIAVSATLTVSEGNDHGPRIAKWKPHWLASEDQDAAA